MYKSEIATLYRITPRSLSRLMNEKYFTELSALGYSKTDQLVSPCVVRKFFELYGEPLTKEEYE